MGFGAMFSLPSLFTDRSAQTFFVATTIATLVAVGATNSAFASSNNGNGATDGPKNVYGRDLALCSTSPKTGYFRNGFCETGPTDFGTHTVCAQVTADFLEFTKARGNDLMTPHPQYQFPGLKPGDGWCLCASRWAEAQRAGVAPPVVLEASHSKTLQYVSMADLESHSVSPGSSTSS